MLQIPRPLRQLMPGRTFRPGRVMRFSKSGRTLITSQNLRNVRRRLIVNDPLVYGVERNCASVSGDDGLISSCAFCRLVAHHSRDASSTLQHVGIKCVQAFTRSVISALGTWLNIPWRWETLQLLSFYLVLLGSSRTGFPEAARVSGSLFSLRYENNWLQKELKPRKD